MRVLVVNSGSSSVKLALLDGDEVVKRVVVDPGDAEDALHKMLEEELDAVGHRVVHGGTRFSVAVVVDDEILAGIEDLRDMAPLHQGPAIAALRQARAALPGIPQVACFDTAFHATIPAAAHTYAVPLECPPRRTPRMVHLQRAPVGPDRRPQACGVPTAPPSTWWPDAHELRTDGPEKETIEWAAALVSHFEREVDGSRRPVCRLAFGSADR